MNLELDPITAILLAMALGFFLLAFLIKCTSKINAFSRELQYLNMEITRTQGEERQRWVREKRRLWLSLLPFYRR